MNNKQGLYWQRNKASKIIILCIEFDSQLKGHRAAIVK